MKEKTAQLSVIGGGLAGSEAAWQAAQRGVHVNLYEMRPVIGTGAHLTGDFAELVCSNSLGSNLIDRASGLLKEEARRLGSLLLECAVENSLPAGFALAVDRNAFAQAVTEKISTHPNIEVIRQEVLEIPQTPVIIATGPLTSTALAGSIRALSGEDALFFYDALAPIISFESIDLSIAFRASRYQFDQNEETGDYINCPFTKEEYDLFVEAVDTAERIVLRPFEQDIISGVTAGVHEFFEGCLPIEIISSRGHNSLAFGPMRPIGLKDPRTGKRPYAVLQLRQDNLAGSLYNMVGFQTNLTFAEQKRVFRLIPGLANTEIIRFGQMHRNTFIASPRLLRPTLQWNTRDDLLFAGQITGVEGYMGNIATGLLAGWNAARLLQGKYPLVLPLTTMLGSLCNYVTHTDMKDFQPMKANFGLLPQLPQVPHQGKRERAGLYARRSLDDLEQFLKKVDQESTIPESQRVTDDDA